MRLQAVVILRHNTKLGGDVALAQREFNALMSRPGRALSTLTGVDQPPSVLGRVMVAPGVNPVAVAFDDCEFDDVLRLLRRSAFAQEVLLSGSTDCLAEFVRSWPHSVLVNELSSTSVVALSAYYVIESESAFKGRSRDRIDAVCSLLLEPYRTKGRTSGASNRLRKAKKTTLCLTHDLHIYKAKFFPRMVRALLNIFGPRNEGVIVDPYCGSGTALLEAALLGYRAAGSDVDPVCAAISTAKVTPFYSPKTVSMRLEELAVAFDSVSPGDADDSEFPDELRQKLRRKDKRNGTELAPEVVMDSARLREAVGKVEDPSALVRTIASDAVTKKVRYRFVGVGNGRYTIEVVKQTIEDRLNQKIQRANELARVIPAVCPEPGEVSVALGDARDPSTWAISSGIDVIVTSPPYLPASSGREHYTAARALSFYVLGVKHGDEGYFDLKDRSDEEQAEFPLEAYPEADRLMTYLMSDKDENADPQRDPMRFERKAVPTLAYLRDMRSFFAAARKALKRDGILLLVVAHHHTFYSHRRSELEHMVSCRDLYGEIAESEGFAIQEEIPMELLKSAASRARPRAKDQYFESVLVLRPQSADSVH